MAAQRADREAVIGELLLEFTEFARVGKHAQLAMRIAGVVAGTQLHGIDIQAFEFLENVFERQLRQQGCEYADSHGMSPYLAKNHPQNITGTSCEGSARRRHAHRSIGVEVFDRSSTYGNVIHHDDSFGAERTGRGSCPAGRGSRASSRFRLLLDGRGDEPQRARTGSRDSGTAGDRRADALGACRAGKRSAAQKRTTPRTPWRTARRSRSRRNPSLGAADPDPCGPENRGEQRFGMARRNIDDEISNAAFGDRLQVIADSTYMEAINERHVWFEHVPGLTDELSQAAGGEFGVNLVPEGGSCQQWREAVRVLHRSNLKSPAWPRFELDRQTSRC